VADSIAPDSTAKQLAKSWPMLGIIGALATPYIATVENRVHDAQTGATVAADRAERAERAGAEAEARVTDRLCNLERAHVAALADAVSRESGFAEPDRRRKAETAQAAKNAFVAASKDWPCRLPNSSLSDHSSERLQALAHSALEVRPR
jgi:hypothetical protein